MTILAWAKLGNGDWNLDPTANPATGAGGIDLTAGGAAALFPIVSISGGGQQTFNFGNTAFSFAVPAGYTAGWPGSGAGGFAAFDPAKLLGTGTLSNNNRTFRQSASFGPTFCQPPDADGKTSGSYYFEMHYDSHGALSNFFGGGIGRKHPGLDYSSFSNTLSPGDYGTGADNDGGIFLGSNYPFAAPNPYHSYFGVFANVLFTGPATPALLYQPGVTVCWALTFGFTPPAGNEISGVGDLWYGPTTTFVDLRASSNRRLFVGIDGSTKYLGDDGSRPFGEAPPIFLSLFAGQAADHWADNLGSGDAFTIADGSLQLFGGSIPPCSTYTVDAGTPPNTPQGADPQIRLSVSDDGGRTFSLLQKWRSMGKIGQYTKRLRWLKMGMFRQRQVRLEITDPVRRNIIGIYMDVTEGLD